MQRRCEFCLHLVTPETWEQHICPQREIHNLRIALNKCRLQRNEHMKDSAQEHGLSLEEIDECAAYDDGELATILSPFRLRDIDGGA